MAGLPGFTPLEPVPSEYKTTSNAPHTGMHDDAVDAINEIAAAFPTALGDLDGFDTSAAGTIPGRKLLLYDTTSGDVILGADADPSGLYVAVADLGQPNSAALLDSAGKLTVDQLPDGIGGSSLQVKDDGGAALAARPYLNIIGANSISDNAGTDSTDVDVSKADVRVLRVASDVAVANQTTPQEITDLTLPMVAGDAFDFDLYLWAYSTTAAKVKAIINGPTGSTMHTLIWGPHSTMTATTVGNQFDISLMRYVTSDVPNTGNQQFGGFTSAGPLTAVLIRAVGSVKCPTGVSGNLVTKIGQVTATADVTCAKAFASKLILSRI